MQFPRNGPEMQHASSVGLNMLSDLEQLTKDIDLIDEKQADVLVQDI